MNDTPNKSMGIFLVLIRYCSRFFCLYTTRKSEYLPIPTNKKSLPAARQDGEHLKSGIATQEQTSVKNITQIYFFTPLLKLI